MKTEDADLSGVKLVIPRRITDHRGFFSETYNHRAFEEIGISKLFVQDNHSYSKRSGTVRGLHFQAPPAAQAKLVRCIRGAVYDVAVDIRRGSPTYGHWTGYVLSATNGAQLYIPEGFAHGFVTLEPDTEIVYKCSNYYASETEGSIRWNDPEIGIEWPLKQAAVLSDRDACAPLLSDFTSPFEFGGGAL